MCFHIGLNVFHHHRTRFMSSFCVIMLAIESFLNKFSFIKPYLNNCHRTSKTTFITLVTPTLHETRKWIFFIPDINITHKVDLDVKLRLKEREFIEESE